MNYGSSIRILISSAIAGAFTFLVVSALAFPAWIRLLIGLGIFVLIVVPLLLLSRSVSHSDIANLSSMVEEIGALGELITKILSLLERIMTFLRL